MANRSNNYDDNFNTNEIKSSSTAVKLSKKAFVSNIVIAVISVLFLIAGLILVIYYSLLNGVHYDNLGNVSINYNISLKEESETISRPDNVSQVTSIEPIEMVTGELLDDPMVLNILLVGAEIEQDEEYGRSDSMIVVSIDTRNKKIKLTSFLRDIWVEIPGYGYERLNSSYSMGGPKLLIETIEGNFGINIDRYIMVDYKGFSSIIDILGGIELELTADEIDYINWQMYKNHQVDTRYYMQDEPGLVKLDGREALWYARNRGNYEIGEPIFEGDDWDRTERQRKLISQFVNMFKNAGIDEIYEIAQEIGPMIRTNFKKSEITSLLFNALTYLNYDIETLSMPGYYENVEEYWPTPYKCVIAIADWQRARKELAVFIYEDSIVA